jgi:group I intron endonuclease
MTCGVYKILNMVDNKVYVGSAVNIERRWNFHKYTLRQGLHSTKFQRAWNKHGEINFQFEILEQCTNNELIEKEQYWIDLLNSVKKGYNILEKAYSPVGIKHSEETKEKMRLGRAKFLETPGAKEDLSRRAKLQHANGKLGRSTWKSDHTRKLRETGLEVGNRPETKQRLKDHIASQSSEEMRRRNLLRKTYGNAYYKGLPRK